MIINKVLFETSYIGNPKVLFFVCFEIVWSFIIIPIFFVIRNWKKCFKDKQNERAMCVLKYVSSVFMPVSIMILLIVDLVMLGIDYNNIVLEYKRGNYCEVEGIVEGYIRRSNSEEFIINDVKFKNNSNPKWGYFTLLGGVITGDGQHLYIRYVVTEGRKSIVYIEELP